jgi:single-strand DNA-binding protein
MSWQQTIIVGNVGTCELKYLQSGAAVYTFSVAVNEKWTTESGERKEKTTWFRCNAWNKQAETLNQYLRKGSQIMVTGTIEARAYMGKDGQPAASLELRVRDFTFLGGRDSVEADNGGNKDDVEIPF